MHPCLKNKTLANEKIKIGARNVHGLTRKEEELKKALEERKIDFAVISETKRKGTSETERYIGIQTGVKKEERAAGGIVLYIQKKYQNQTEHYNIWSNRIVSVRITSKRHYMTIITAFALEEEEKELINALYTVLQKAIQRSNLKEE